MSTDNVVTLVVRERPPSANKQRGKNSRWETAEETAFWRDMGRVLMLEQIRARNIPIKVKSISVEARQLAKNKAHHQDVGNCFPAVKAIVDGIADSHLIDNDTARHQTRLTFEPCFIAGFDGLQVDVTWIPYPKETS